LNSELKLIQYRLSILTDSKDKIELMLLSRASVAVNNDLAQQA
jgi:hypothetical protein